VAHEVPDVGARVGGDVEQLADDHARARVAGDVAHRVAAALARRQAGLGELAHHLGHVGERHVMHLDVLAGRDVALAQRHVAVDHARERIELVRGDAAHRQLDADHLHVGLALAVDALLQAELDEVGLLQVTAQEAGRLGLEIVEFTLEDRNHMPGHVVDHFWILARAGAGCGLRHHGSFRWREPIASETTKSRSE
jgi:hypothetical protein